MDIQTTSVILIFLTLLVAGYAVYRLHTQGVVLTPTVLKEAIVTAQPIAQDLLSIGTIAAQAVEQIARDPSKPLMTNDAKLHFAIDYVKSYLKRVYPDIDNITDEDIINAVNSGVLVASTLTNHIKADKASVISDENTVKTVEVLSS